MKQLLFLFAAIFLASCSKEATPDFRIPSPGSIISYEKYEDIFTTEELEFINQRKIIRIAGEFNYPPFLFYDENGMLVGLSRDYMEEVAKITGLRLSIQLVAQRAGVFQALAEKQVDIVASIRPAPGRDYLATTQPYINSRGVFVVRSDFRPADIKNIGTVRGSAQAYYITHNHPNLTPVDITDDEACLKTLIAKEIESCMMNIETFTALANLFGGGVENFTTIAIPFDYILGLGYHKDNTILGAILIKALNAMSSESREKIEKKWLVEPNRTKLCTAGLFHCNVPN